MQPRIIVHPFHFNIILQRLCYQIIETHRPFSDTILIGIQPRGVQLSRLVCEKINEIISENSISYGEIDTTFYRDDFRNTNKPLVPYETQIHHNIDNKKVILIDDVLYTGRTIRAAMDALLEYGRPAKVELLCFIDRRYSRELPVEPNYTGLQIDSINSEKVKLEWNVSHSEATIFIIPKNPISNEPKP
jgi:pyrimidine operon attenuation protein / uracil phosphoribosyltransferase